MDLPVWSVVLLGLGVFVIGSVGGLALVSLVLIRLPANYFQTDRPLTLWVDRHPVVRWTGIVAKNLAGGLVLVFGAVLSTPGIPGPGLLMILLGIMLLDFPGKRQMERWLISWPRVFDTINRLRKRYRRPPFDLG
jgi:hypothetical protein